MTLQNTPLRSPVSRLLKVNSLSLECQLTRHAYSIDHLGVISITSNLECSLGIIGSSLPPLRKLFKFYYGSSHDGNYKITGEVSEELALGCVAVGGLTRDFLQSGDALGSAGPGIKLGSLSGNDRTYHASAKRGTSRAGTREHETDDDDSSSRKGIIRKTDIHVSTSTFHA